MTGNSAAAVRLITSLRKKLQEGNKKSPVSTSAESKLNKTQEENLTKKIAEGTPRIIDDIYDSEVLTKTDHVL